MTYLSDSLKKEYHASTDLQRVKNLKKLREHIAKLSLTSFSKKIGITKNDISRYETGEKTLSLFSILAYKKYFYENHQINLSIDFIMGFTDILENSNLNYQNEIGLSNDSIEMLKIWKNQHEQYGKTIPALGNDVQIINTLLEYQLELTKKVAPNFATWSVFHYIGQYLTPHKMKREQQNRLRICDGASWVDIECGDTVKKKDGSKHTIENMEAINDKSGSGSNTSTVHVVNDNNDEHYVLDIDAMFKSYCKDNIFSVLDKIKDYISKRRG